jgi:GH15 family glucan-1,4-alpha-glucosidase
VSPRPTPPTRPAPRCCSTLLARPAFSAVSSGFLGTSDGWTDLESDFRMDFHHRLAEGGNVVQTGRTRLTGLPGGQRLTLSLGLGTTQGEALTTAGESLDGGFDRAAGDYAAGWHAYLDTLAPVPASAQRWSSLYEVANGPITPQERWENAGPGYSPATIAAEIAGLVCGADLARRNGQPELASRWLQVADAWRRDVDSWTLTRTGPLATTPYYLRITLDGQPDAATPIQISDGGPLVDQRRVVDPSFLELVRLGVKGVDDPAVVATLPVVDRQLAVNTPGGRFWHRFDFDGYGETRDGGPWRITDPGTGLTLGRAWPIFAGERGEYELAAVACRYRTSAPGSRNTCRHPAVGRGCGPQARGEGPSRGGNVQRGDAPAPGRQELRHRGDPRP